MQFVHWLGKWAFFERNIKRIILTLKINSMTNLVCLPISRSVSYRKFSGVNILCNFSFFIFLFDDDGWWSVYTSCCVLLDSSRWTWYPCPADRYPLPSPLREDVKTIKMFNLRQSCGFRQFCTGSGTRIQLSKFLIWILLESDLISKILIFFVIFIPFRVDTQILLEDHII